MVFNAVPENFAAIYKDVLYEIGGIPEGETADVEIIGGGENLLGVKRFQGGGTVAVNIAGYLKREFAPEPVRDGGTGFVFDPGRSVVAYVRAGGITTAIRYFAGAQNGVGESELLSLIPGERTLAPGEFDELSIAVSEGVLIAEIEVEGGRAFAFGPGMSRNLKGVVTLRVSADDIAARAAERGIDYGECESATVSVRHQSGMVREARYRLRHESALGSVRLAWLNSLGGIDYHTFDILNEESVKVVREGFLSERGYDTLSVSTEKIVDITAGYHPAAMMAALGEIVSSRYVWMLEGGRAVKVRVVNDSVTLRADKLTNLKLKIAVPGK